MSIRKYILTMLAVCLYGFGAMAQEMPSVVPPAPEAASLGKYTDMPVNYSSGLPQISIPMFTASSRDISVPVSLSYHAGGIKVEEIASRAGLGWNLQAGGSISRTVRGIADDGPDGWLDPRRTVADFEAANLGNKYNYITEALDGSNDYEPDIFNFSYPGGGGKFFFDDNGDVITIPASEHKITYTMGGTLGGIASFVVTNNSGYKYFYGDYGGNVARDSTGTTQSFTDDGSTGGITAPSDKARNQYSSWHLLAIQSPVSDATVTFSYGSQDTKSLNRGSQTKMYDFVSEQTCPAPMGMRTSYILSENRETVLNTITFENGSIDFIYDTTERTDLEGSKALDKVRLKNAAGIILKTFDLVQGYWTSTDHTKTTSPFAFVDKEHLTKRLYLQKVIESGENNSDPKEYLFDYNDATGMPQRFSFAQDVWGFYNGQTGNTSLIPEFINPDTLSTRPSNETLLIINGANRRSNTESSKVYSLKSITYPTGGKASFDFESNGVYLSKLDTVFQTTPYEIDEEVLANYVYSSGTNSTEIQFDIDNTHLNGMVRFNYTLDGCSQGEGEPGGINYCGVQATLRGVTDTGYNRVLSLNEGAHFKLPEGTYKLEIDIIEPDSVNAATAKIIAFNNASPYADRGEFEVGGLRVLRTTMDDNFGNKLIKEYSYITNEYATNASDYGSSGVLGAQKWVFHEEDVEYCNNVTAVANQLSSQSPVPAAGTGAGHVVYTMVVETSLPDNGSSPGNSSGTSFLHGFALNQFDFAADTAHAETESFPFAPYAQVDWKRGNQIKQSVFERDGIAFKQIQLDSIQVAYTTSSDALYKKVRAMKVDQRGSRKDWAYYYVYSGANHVTKKITKTTQDNGVIEQSTDFEYNNHYLRPDKTITNHSDGQKTIVKTKYTDDTFGNELTLAEKNVLSSMLTANILSPVLTETFAENENTPIAKSLTTFGNLSPGFLPLSTKIWNRDTDTYEERLTFSYTANGNYEHLVKDGHQQMAYIWNYGNTRPTAQVTNVSSVADIAYSSFESTGKGNWSYGGTTIAAANLPSGAKYYNLNGNAVTKSGLTSSKKYVVSFWAKDGTPAVTYVDSSHDAASANAFGWKYYEKVITGTTSFAISGNAKIDELRLYPLNAPMRTYTYDPLRGVTSMGSANNLFTHYEYDEHGRLSVIRDQDGNILKMNKYAYKVDVNEVQN